MEADDMLERQSADHTGDEQKVPPEHEVPPNVSQEVTVLIC